MSATPFDTKGVRARGAVLVVHGLNTKPEVMDELVRLMLASGYHCQCVSLYGDVSTRRARSDAIVARWVHALSSGYEEARIRWPGVPVHALGFSIGALLIVQLVNVSADVSFERMVLLAPPVVLTKTANLVRTLTPLAQVGAVLPSAAPRHVRARWGTPLSEYAAMLSLADGLQTLDSRQKLSAIPTSVVLDRGDELVSFEGVEDWMLRNDLRAWQLQDLRDRVSPRRTYRHLIVTRAAIGPRAWDRLTDDILRHFDAAAGSPEPPPPGP